MVTTQLKLTKYLDTQKVKTVQKLTPKQANTENQIRSTALDMHLLPNFFVNKLQKRKYDDVFLIQMLDRAYA